MAQSDSSEKLQTKDSITFEKLSLKKLQAEREEDKPSALNIVRFE
jgi:hypothetical protein